MLVPCVSACALKQGGTLGVTRAPKQGGTVDVTRALKRPPIANGKGKIFCLRQDSNTRPLVGSDIEKIFRRRSDSNTRPFAQSQSWKNYTVTSAAYVQYKPCSTFNLPTLCRSERLGARF